MSKASEWWSRHSILLTGIIGTLVIIGISLLMVVTIPNCPVCGQKEYRLEVDHYVTTFTWVGKVMIPQQTPIYKSVPHVCPGRSR